MNVLLVISVSYHYLKYNYYKFILSCVLILVLALLLNNIIMHYYAIRERVHRNAVGTINITLIKARSKLMRVDKQKFAKGISQLSFPSQTRRRLA